MLSAVALPFLLMAASYTDIRDRIIPNGICAMICLCALPNVSAENFLGVSLALPLLLIGVLSDGIGGGDIKLSGALGFALGYQCILVTLLSGLSVMLLFHAVRTMIRKRKNEAICCTYPMAPFIAVGYGIMLLVKII